MHFKKKIELEELKGVQEIRENGQETKEVVLLSLNKRKMRDEDMPG